MRLLDLGLHRNTREQGLLLNFLQVLQAGPERRLDTHLLGQRLAFDQLLVERCRTAAGRLPELRFEPFAPARQGIAYLLVELWHIVEFLGDDVGCGLDTERREQRYAAGAETGHAGRLDVEAV